MKLKNGDPIPFLNTNHIISKVLLIVILVIWAAVWNYTICAAMMALPFSVLMGYGFRGMRFTRPPQNPEPEQIYVIGQEDGNVYPVNDINEEEVVLRALAEYRMTLKN